MNDTVICPQCDTSNSLKAVHCTNCGNNLRIQTEGYDDATLMVGDDETNPPPDIHPNRRALFPRHGKLILNLRSGEEIPCDLSRNIVIVGRGDRNDMDLPQVNLAHLNAQQMGVSRQHARIMRLNVTIMLQDLGSSNGTSLNGERLSAGKAYVVCDGDEIRLGNLELTIEFRRD